MGTYGSCDRRWYRNSFKVGINNLLFLYIFIGDMMKITKRDLEAIIKKDFQFENQCIYMDNIPIFLKVVNGALVVQCNQWIDLLKLFLRSKKYIHFYQDYLEIKHPLFSFDSVKILEDEIEITFK